MANDVVLNSVWSQNYALEHRESTPEEKIIDHEETENWKTIMNIYVNQGSEELIKYFLNLKSRKMEMVSSIIDFFKKMRKVEEIKISKVSLKKLIEEAQIERQQNYYSPTFDLGRTLFGSDKFNRMLRAR